MGREVTRVAQAPSNCRARRQMTTRANLFLRQLGLLELHVHAAASGVDSNALLRRKNADYHTGLI
jgi:hypothetical protein